MGAPFEDLLIEGRFGDFAFRNVNDQAIVGADKANIEALLELVPLAADHDPVAVTVRLRARDDGRDDGGIDAAEAVKQIANLFVLKPELRGIGQVLVLATAAIAEITASRFDPLRRWLNDAQQ